MSVCMLAITVEIAIMFVFIIACTLSAMSIVLFATPLVILMVTTISIAVLMRLIMLLRVCRLETVGRAPILMKSNGQGVGTEGGREQGQDR